VQISLNLAYGSAMASIGLTIPTIAVAMIWLPGPLELGLGPTQLVLLTITVVVTAFTVVQGRAYALQGFVHLVLFFAFLFSPSSREACGRRAAGGGRRAAGGGRRAARQDGAEGGGRAPEVATDGLPVIV
jgi:hypothetical protein